MTARIQESGLQIAEPLWRLVNNEIAPGTGIEPSVFWANFATILQELGPQNKMLLDKRDALQAQIDAWHQAHCHQPHDAKAYKDFLYDIGYLVPEGPAFKVTTANVDSEIAEQAGPQLVVPVKNARFALNAANARWGSLYDALYGTDAISEAEGAERGKQYNPVRGAKVIAFARQHLDNAAPLVSGSHKNAVSYKIVAGELIVLLEKWCANDLGTTRKMFRLSR